MIVKELDNNQVRLDLLAKQIMQVEVTFTSNIITKCVNNKNEEENNSISDLFKKLQERLADLQEKERLRIDMFFHIKNQYSLYEELIQAVKEQKEIEEQLANEIKQHELRKIGLKSKTNAQDYFSIKGALNASKTGYLSNIQSNPDSYEASPKNYGNGKIILGHKSQKPPRAQQRFLSAAVRDSHENHNESNVSFETMQTPGTLSNFFSQSIPELQNHAPEGLVNHSNVQDTGSSTKGTKGQSSGIAYFDNKRGSADWNTPVIKSQNYTDYYESYPQFKGTQDEERKHKYSDADDSSVRTYGDNTSKSQCATPQLPQLGSHSSSLIVRNSKLLIFQARKLK